MCSRTQLGSAVLIVAAVISGCRNPSVADPPDVVATRGIPAPVEPKWLTADDLEKMDEAAADDVDDMDVFVLMSLGTLEADNDTAKATSARDDALTAIVLMTKHALHQLFYEVSLDTNRHPADDPQFYSALVTFEQNAGLAVDGIFSVAEFDHLMYLAALETEQRISLPFKLVHGDGSTYVSAIGTWVIQGEQIAYPLNTSAITCRRSDGSCADFHVDVRVPTPTSSGAQVMTVSDYYDITNWTPTEVRAVNRTFCRQNVLTINISTETVHIVSTDLTEEGCPLSGPLEKPRLTTLEDGFQIAQAYFDERREALAGISRSPIEEIRTLFSGDVQAGAR